MWPSYSSPKFALEINLGVVPKSLRTPAIPKVAKLLGVVLVALPVPPFWCHRGGKAGRFFSGRIKLSGNIFRRKTSARLDLKKKSRKFQGMFCLRVCRRRVKEPRREVRATTRNICSSK